MDPLKNQSKVTFQNTSREDEVLPSLSEGEGFGEGFLMNLSSLSVSQGVLNKLIDDTCQYIDYQQLLADKRRRRDVGLFDINDIIAAFAIGDQMYKDLTFRETLVIGKLDDYGKPVAVGGLCIDVQEAEGKPPEEMLMETYEKKLFKLLDKEGLADHLGDSSEWDDLSLSNDELPVYSRSKMLVHVSSQFSVNGCNGGSNITSWVDRNLHTLEELRKEFFVEDETINEKSLFMALKHKWYYVKHTSSPNFEDDRKLYSTVKARDYVSEGASIILERYLAVTRYLGTFELAAAYINGDLCSNIYECFGPKSIKFNGKRVDGCEIRRTIIEECGNIHIANTELTLTGRILNQRWDDCDYCIYMNPEVDPNNPNKLGCFEDTIIKNWENDIQLFSSYLDQKDMNLMKNKTYLLDHPEIKNILEDYVGSILLLKPPDVIKYTMKYFEKFLPSELPRMDYFD